jgi:hypothetical protein
VPPNRDGTSRGKITHACAYLTEAAGRGLSGAAKVLLFAANTRGSALLRHATLKNLLRQLMPSPRLHPMELSNGRSNTETQDKAHD